MVAMCCDQNGSTALILAAYNGKTETAQALIALGADIHAKNNVSTPYTHAMIMILNDEYAMHG